MADWKFNNSGPLAAVLISAYHHTQPGVPPDGPGAENRPLEPDLVKTSGGTAQPDGLRILRAVRAHPPMIDQRW